MSDESDDYYESPVDGHSHYGVRARQECAVCTLELERDAAMRVLRDFTERVATAAGVSLVWSEADRVGEPGTPKYNDRLIADVERAMAERDRLQAIIDRFRGLFVAANKDRRYAWRELLLENERAVDLKIERDRLRADLADVGDMIDTETRDGQQRDARSVLAALIAERNRLRVVAEAARVVCVTYDSEDLDRISEALPAAVDQLVAELRVHYAALGEDFDVLFNHIDITEPT